MTQTKDGAGEVEPNVTNGQHYDADDFGPIGDAARRICSWAEGPARRHIYEASKRELKASSSPQPADVERMREALTAAYHILADAPELNPSNYDHDDVCALNAASVEAYSVLHDAMTQGAALSAASPASPKEVR